MPARLDHITISNFRCFGLEHQGLELRGDPMVVLHGDNAAGKSTALAAIDLAMRAAWTALRGSGSIRLNWDSWDTKTGLFVSRRMWPHDTRSESLMIALKFANEASFLVILQPSAEGFLLGTSADSLPKDERRELFERWFGSPTGARSPFARIDSLRRGTWLDPLPSIRRPKERQSLLSESLLLRLRLLQDSDELDERDRWRTFASLAARFESLGGMEFRIHNDRKGGGDVLSVEQPGKAIYRFDELSSGERQVIAVCAAVVASGAPIVAIEEPELNLSPRWQATLKGALQHLLDRGAVSQILLESHVHAFDGPEVLRLRRENGVTQVERAPGGHREADSELVAKAKDVGAERQWVSADGYTRLPAELVDHMLAGEAGHLWFLPSGKFWEAWTEGQLDDALGGKKGSEQED